MRRPRILIFGLGSYKNGSGIAAARFFLSQGADVRVTDLKNESELVAQVCELKKLATAGQLEFILGEHREEDITWANTIVQNPSIPDRSPYLVTARKLGKVITNDLAIFLAKAKSNPVLGVTGTRGKSTTASLLYEMVKKSYPRAHLGGNIGVSPLSFLDQLHPEDPVVLELSSWLLHHVTTGPKIAVVTNIFEDHLNHYRSLVEYEAAKVRILQGTGLAVLNWDNERTRALEEIAQEFGRQVFWFSTRHCPPGAGLYQKDGKLVARWYGSARGWHEQEVAQVSDIRLLGTHNLANVLAAATAAWQFGVPFSEIRSAIRGFTGLADRLELVRVRDLVSWYNDTTATSPDAVLAALSALGQPEKIVLIVGGSDKGLTYDEMVRAIKGQVKSIILLPGSATNKLISLLPQGAYHLVASMSEAVDLAKTLAKSGESVLLSPGAASFGLFKNEFDRGKQFTDEIKKLSS